MVESPTTTYPYELRLPIAPYRFEWAHEPAVDCRSSHNELFSEEHYIHHDGTAVIIRNYVADGSFHLLSNRGEIRLVDNANDHRVPNPISVVLLP